MRFGASSVILEAANCVKGDNMVLNHRPYKGWREGITVQDVIRENKFTWPKLVVKVNKKLVWPEEYEQTVLMEEDDLEVMHLLGGG